MFIKSTVGFLHTCSIAFTIFDPPISLLQDFPFDIMASSDPLTPMPTNEQTQDLATSETGPNNTGRDPPSDLTQPPTTDICMPSLTQAPFDIEDHDVLKADYLADPENFPYPVLLYAPKNRKDPIPLYVFQSPTSKSFGRSDSDITPDISFPPPEYMYVSRISFECSYDALTDYVTMTIRNRWPLRLTAPKTEARNLKLNDTLQFNSSHKLSYKDFDIYLDTPTSIYSVISGRSHTSPTSNDAFCKQKRAATLSINHAIESLQLWERAAASSSIEDDLNTAALTFAPSIQAAISRLMPLDKSCFRVLSPPHERGLKRPPSPVQYEGTQPKRRLGDGEMSMFLEEQKKAIDARRFIRYHGKNSRRSVEVQRYRAVLNRAKNLKCYFYCNFGNCKEGKRCLFSHHVPAVKCPGKMEMENFTATIRAWYPDRDKPFGFASSPFGDIYCAASDMNGIPPSTPPFSVIIGHLDETEMKEDGSKKCVRGKNIRVPFTKAGGAEEVN